MNSVNTVHSFQSISMSTIKYQSSTNLARYRKDVTLYDHHAIMNLHIQFQNFGHKYLGAFGHIVYEVF